MQSGRFLQGAAMTDTARPAPPSDLGKDGRKLWRRIQGAVSPDWLLDEREEAALFSACQAADRLAALDAVIDSEGVMVNGSRGQRVLHPALGEARQLRLAQARLLDSLELEDPGAKERREPMSSRRARRAAEVRHGLRAVG
jgi:P27 family predicted phage terminase small subunit